MTHEQHAPNERPRDSAGVPFAGRELKPHAFSGDDGRADSRLLDALQAVDAFPYEAAAHQAVVNALSGVRLYAPIVPIAVDQEVGEHGHMVDNSSDMAMVRLQSSDGREATPGFSSIPPLTEWHPQARPVPIESERLALGAVEAGSQLLVLDPGTPSSFLVRRPALFAFAQGLDWTPSWADSEVSAGLTRIAESFGWVRKLGVGPGSARVVVEGPELSIHLGVDSEVPAQQLQEFQAAVAADADLVARIDSLTLRLSTL